MQSLFYLQVTNLSQWTLQSIEALEGKTPHYLFFISVNGHQLCSSVSAVLSAIFPRISLSGEEIAGATEHLPSCRTSSLWKKHQTT